MPGYNCELHGPQFAIPLCEHLEEAVRARQPAAAYLQYVHGDGVALCDQCVRRWDVPEPFAMANCLVCCQCLLEWESVSGNDFSRRCREAKPEYPSGFSPPREYVAPAGAITVGDATFLFDGEWRVVTRTGAWSFVDHPHGFWPILELPWPRVDAAVVAEGGHPFPLEAIVDSVLAEPTAYYLGRVFDYVVAGFSVSPETREAVLRAVERWPERTRASVRRALGA